MNDILFFNKAYIDQVMHIKNTLDHFAKVSWLGVKPTQSKAYTSKATPRRVQQEFNAITGNHFTL